MGGHASLSPRRAAAASEAEADVTSGDVAEAEAEADVTSGSEAEGEAGDMVMVGAVGATH